MKLKSILRLVRESIINLRYQINTKCNPRGFSLVEIMLVTVIMGVTMAAMTTFLNHQIKSTNYIRDLFDKEEFRREARLLLDDLGTCNESFKNFKVSTIGKTEKLDKIVRKDGTVLYDTKGNHDFANLKIHNIEVINKTIADPASTGLVEIKFSLTRKKKGFGPAVFQDIVLPIVMSVDTSMNFSACGMESNFAIAAFTLTPWIYLTTLGDKSLPIYPAGTRISYGRVGKTYSSGNINVDSQGIKFEVDGCYLVRMGARLTNSGKTPGYDGGVRLSWYKNTVSAANKLSHIHAGGKDFQTYFHDKPLFKDFKRGDRVITSMEINSEKARLVFAQMTSYYISDVCKAGSYPAWKYNPKYHY